MTGLGATVISNSSAEDEIEIKRFFGGRLLSNEAIVYVAGNDGKDDDSLATAWACSRISARTTSIKYDELMILSSVRVVGTCKCICFIATIGGACRTDEASNLLH